MRQIRRIPLSLSFVLFCFNLYANSLKTDLYEITEDLIPVKNLGECYALPEFKFSGSQEMIPVGKHPIKGVEAPRPEFGGIAVQGVGYKPSIDNFFLEKNFSDFSTSLPQKKILTRFLTDYIIASQEPHSRYFPRLFSTLENSRSFSKLKPHPPLRIKKKVKVMHPFFGYVNKIFYTASRAYFITVLFKTEKLKQKFKRMVLDRTDDHSFLKKIDIFLTKNKNSLSITFHILKGDKLEEEAPEPVEGETFLAFQKKVESFIRYERMGRPKREQMLVYSVNLKKA